MDFIMPHCSPSEERVCYILCGYHLTFEEKAAFAELLVLKIESVFICAGFKGRKGEGLQHHSSACSLQSRKGQKCYFPLQCIQPGFRLSQNWVEAFSPLEQKKKKIKR